MTNAKEPTSHKQILKSTSILGGAQIITILIRILRNKIIAVLLGPVGLGTAGLYQSIIDLVRSATGFGLNSSAVRDIGQAVGINNQQAIARTILILRRWIWFTGLLGLILCLVFCKVLSRYAFGNETYALGVAVLSVVLLMDAVSGGQLALLQGLRRIRTMATANVIGVIMGFCITIPLYWLLGVKGIVPAIILTSAASLFLSWFYARRIPVQPVPLSVSETVQGGLGMVRLGFCMMISSFAMTAVMYLVRSFVSDKNGIEGVGQFQAAFSLSSVYLAAVLQAMSTDYFPRLSAVNTDNTKVIQLVNEQTEIGLLIASPLIVGMLSFINIVVYILYSAKFTEAVNILHWQLAGTFLQVISWPISYIILAKARGGIFICVELCWIGTYVCLVCFGWKAFGLEATGIGFLIAYLFYLIIINQTCRSMCGFSWSNKVLKYIFVFGLIILLAFLNSKYISGFRGYWIGGLLLLSVAGYSFYELRKVVDLKTVFNKIMHR